MALLLLRTLESIAAHCSVKTVTCFEYLILEDVTICDILPVSHIRHQPVIEIISTLVKLQISSFVIVKSSISQF